MRTPIRFGTRNVLFRLTMCVAVGVRVMVVGLTWVTPLVLIAMVTLCPGPTSLALLRTAVPMNTAMPLSSVTGVFRSRGTACIRPFTTQSRGIGVLVGGVMVGSDSPICFYALLVDDDAKVDGSVSDGAVWFDVREYGSSYGVSYNNFFWLCCECSVYECASTGVWGSEAA